MKAPFHEVTLIEAISMRAIGYIEVLWTQQLFIDYQMDLTGCHLNGCPLKLQELLNTDQEKWFVEDVGYIRLNLDRNTGKLANGFWPRFALNPRPFI